MCSTYRCSKSYSMSCLWTSSTLIFIRINMYIYICMCIGKLYHTVHTHRYIYIYYIFMFIDEVYMSSPALRYGVDIAVCVCKITSIFWPDVSRDDDGMIRFGRPMERKKKPVSCCRFDELNYIASWYSSKRPSWQQLPRPEEEPT